MFLSKKKAQAPDAPRSELDATARVHGSPGQRIFALMVAVGATVVIFGAVGYFYIWPQWQAKEKAAQVEEKSPEVSAKPAQLVVPLDPNEGAQPAAAEATDDVYKPQPGLAGDAKPSASQAAQGRAQTGGQTHQVGVTGRETPPGMSGQQGDGEGATDPANQNRLSDKDQARVRKLGGELGYFGETATPRIERVGGQHGSAAPAPADEACARIDGGPEAVAECNSRVAASRPPAAPTVRPALSQPAPAGPQNQLAGQLVAVPTPDGAVGFIPHPHLTLQKGEPITCTLDTAIQTDLFGFVECITDFPIKSMDGKVVLAERGTRITGEYSRDLAPGARSIFVLWTRGTTPAPYHVTFDLLSPGSDRLGRSGISGDVDDKFWQRYKGPLMFSLLQDASAAAAAKASGQGATNSAVVVLPSTQNAGQSAVAELLKQSGDIKASLYRNQGETISITVARYIDFSSVYRLRSAKGGRND
jgi:type IV secretion system protein VirB10